MHTESCNIEHTNVVGGRAERNALIYVQHNAVEQSAVQRLGQGIASIICLVDLQWNPLENAQTRKTDEYIKFQNN